MFAAIIPKLPMRNKKLTIDFYVDFLGFTNIGFKDFEDYLLLQKDGTELHFFKHNDLDVTTNYGQIYIRVNNIEIYLQSLLLKKDETVNKIEHVQIKPWGQKEFSLLDPDNNLLTFGQKA